MIAHPAALPPSDVDELGRLDATAQAALVGSGEVTAAELVDAAIERIERLDPALNAVVTTVFDRARLEVATGLPDGPFTGVPHPSRIWRSRTVGCASPRAPRSCATTSRCTTRSWSCGCAALGW